KVRSTLVASGRALTDAAHLWKHKVHERQELRYQVWGKRLEPDGQVGGAGEDHFAVTPLTGEQDLPSRGRRIDGNQREGVADAEPGVFLAVLSLEGGIARAPGAHQPWTDRGNQDAVPSQLGPQSIGETHERELASSIREHVRHGAFA